MTNPNESGRDWPYPTGEPVDVTPPSPPDGLDAPTAHPVSRWPDPWAVTADVHPQAAAPSPAGTDTLSGWGTPAAPAGPQPAAGQAAWPAWTAPDTRGSHDGRGRRGTGAVVAVAAVVALVTGLIGGLAGGWLADTARERSVNDPGFALPSPENAATQRAPGTVPSVASGVLPSVVALRVNGADAEGTGSGFVIEGGYILTNNHVVSLASSGGDIRVVFQDGSQAKGTIVGRDPSYDLAVVKADTGGRRALTLGDSTGVVVGDPVIAVGAPLGLQGTVTTGIVSALNRPVVAGDQGETAFINAIQTDAAINPGNSGGPLVDARGRVIGINSAIARAPGGGAGTAGNIGLGFAIPSNQARRTAEQLVRTGTSAHPVIGVLLDQRYTGEGVRVADAPQGDQPPVTPGGPADTAGVRPGDVILAVDSTPVTAPEELIVQVRSRAVGESVVLTVRRDGQRQRITVTLAASDG